jgi:hypothetical protein
LKKHDQFSVLQALSASQDRQRSILSSPRLEEMATFGALVALAIISQMFPSDISPLLLHFLAHQRDLSSLTPAIVGEWFPELRRCIEELRELGPTGDLTRSSLITSFLATYLDLQVSSLLLVPRLGSNFNHSLGV